MLEVLPELHDDSSTLAALVLLPILSGSATPAQLLQSAIAVLHKLPLHSESGSNPSNGQVQLACNLLRLFTAEAFQALPVPKGKSKAAKAAASPIADGLDLLLELLRAGDEAHQPHNAQLVKLRVAAFQRLTAELYAVMPVQQQMQAFLVRMSGSVTKPLFKPPYVETTL